MHTAAQASQASVGLQKTLGRDAPHREDELRLNQGNLPVQVLAALGRFFGLWVAVIRWPAFEDIGNVDSLA